MRTDHRRAADRALASLIFLCVVAYCVAIRAACGCFGCSAQISCLWQSGGDDPVGSADFQDRDRWRDTAIDGPAIDVAGEPVNLTWGIVADGTPISRNYIDTFPSDFIAMMNDAYGSSRGGVSESPWFTLLEQSFGRWEELTGIDFEYEPADGGAQIDGVATPRGSLGEYADIRIGGYGVDGAGGTLAFAWYPDAGDIVFDTGDWANFDNTGDNSRFFRNVLMHEIGHAIGLAHLESNDSAHLMEPNINTSFDGPQIDDILGAQRIYGDALEKNGGNDQAETATELGSFGAGADFEMGIDANDTRVEPDETDFVSIDGVTDTDFFRFTITEPALLNARMIPQGPTYNEGPQDGEQTPLVTNLLNDLDVALLAFTGDALETLAVGVPRGTNPAESISDVTLSPGEYFFRVTGQDDNVQLYSLAFSLTGGVIPEPGGAALAATLLAAAGGARARRPSCCSRIKV